MKEENEETRVKLSVNLNAKGFCQWDVTSEFPTLADAKANLDGALKAVKETITSNGYKEAGASS